MSGANRRKTHSNPLEINYFFFYDCMSDTAELVPEGGGQAKWLLGGRDASLPDFGTALVAGVDEAGRGPLAGPVVASAVILPRSRYTHRYRDSKQLGTAERTHLYRLIRKEAVACAIGRAEVAEIDEMNILRASLLAMARALSALEVTPDLALVDGNHVPGSDLPCYAVIGGDARIAAVSAASIVAKVERDWEMLQLHRRYPVYNFASNKGYPTKEHIRSLDRHGVCDVHRKSYRPVRERLAAMSASSPASG